MNDSNEFISLLNQLTLDTESTIVFTSTERTCKNPLPDPNTSPTRLRKRKAKSTRCKKRGSTYAIDMIAISTGMIQDYIWHPNHTIMMESKSTIKERKPEKLIFQWSILPSKVTQHVFSFLCSKQLALCCRVCKEWNEICSNQEWWRIRVQKELYETSYLEMKRERALNCKQLYGVMCMLEKELKEDCFGFIANICEITNYFMTFEQRRMIEETVLVLWMTPSLFKIVPKQGLMGSLMARNSEFINVVQMKPQLMQKLSEYDILQLLKKCPKETAIKLIKIDTSLTRLRSFGVCALLRARPDLAAELLSQKAVICKMSKLDWTSILGANLSVAQTILTNDRLFQLGQYSKNDIESICYISVEFADLVTSIPKRVELLDAKQLLDIFDKHPSCIKNILKNEKVLKTISTAPYWIANEMFYSNANITLFTLDFIQNANPLTNVKFIIEGDPFIYF